MEKKIKYIPCTFDDEIGKFLESNICLTRQEKILQQKRKVERSKRESDYFKIKFNIFFNPVNNIPELILESNSAILKRVYKLGFYSFDSILDYYKLNYGEEEDLFIMQFDNLILSFKKYKGELISDKQKELIKQEQLFANQELINTIEHQEEVIKKFTEIYTKQRKEKSKINKEIKIQSKIEKEKEIERQKQIKELRKKLAYERRKEKKNIVGNKREVTLMRKLDLIPKKLCKFCKTELVYNSGKEFIATYKKRLFCNRSCYDTYNRDRKEERTEERNRKRLQYAREYRLKYNSKLKEKNLEKKKEKLNSLPFQICRNCSNSIPKEIAFNQIKIYERLRFCSENCKKEFPIKKQRQKAEQEKNKLLQKKLKKEKIEQEKLLKQKLRDEKKIQKEKFILAVKNWDEKFNSKDN